MTIDSDGGQDDGITSVETLFEFSEKGYSMQRLSELSNPRGMVEYVLKKEKIPLLQVAIDRRGDIIAELRTRIDAKKFTELAGRFLRFTTSEEPSEPEIFKDEEFTSITSPDTDTHLMFWPVAGQSPFGASKIEANIPNNRRVDRESALLSLVGFVDSCGEGNIPRPLVHTIVQSANRESEKTPPRE